MTRRAVLGVVLFLAGAYAWAGAVAAGPGEPAGRRLPLRNLELGAAAGSGQPFLSVTPDGEVLASWLEPAGPARTRMRFARFDGTRWSTPRTISEGEGFFVNWADVPSIVALGSNRLAAHWLQKSGPGTYAYDVRVVQSPDGGLTWGLPVTPHRDGTQTEHGFASLYTGPTGRLGLVWLDGRETAVPAGHDAHGGPGAMTLRAAEIDRDGTASGERVVDARVCDCCPTTAIVLDGEVLVAYRDRSDGGEVRDIALARRTGREWAQQSGPRDGWEIPACPVNGPALARSGGHVWLAWFTAEANAPRVLAARSSDRGRRFGPGVRVDDGIALGRVSAAALPDGSAMVGWIEFLEPGAEFRVRRVAAEGTLGPSWTVSAVGSGRSSGYPRLVVARSQLVLAWIDASGELRTAVAALNP